MSFQRVCDRCKQLAEADRSDALGDAKITFSGSRHAFLDLCGKCARIIYAYIKTGKLPTQ